MEKPYEVTLLIVDDATDISRHVSAALRQITCETVWLRRNKVRQLRLQNIGARTIYLATRMSLQEGCRLLSRLRTQSDHGSVRAIVVTAAITHEAAASLKKNGVDDLLVAPFRARSLIEKMAA